MKPEIIYFTSEKSLTIELLTLLLFYQSSETIEKQTEKARGSMWTPNCSGKSINSNIPDLS